MFNMYTLMLTSASKFSRETSYDTRYALPVVGDLMVVGIGDPGMVSTLSKQTL